MNTLEIMCLFQEFIERLQCSSTIFTLVLKMCKFQTLNLLCQKRPHLLQQIGEVRGWGAGLREHMLRMPVLLGESVFVNMYSIESALDSNAGGRDALLKDRSADSIYSDLFDLMGPDEISKVLERFSNSRNVTYSVQRFHFSRYRFSASRYALRLESFDGVMLAHCDVQDARIFVADRAIEQSFVTLVSLFAVMKKMGMRGEYLLSYGEKTDGARYHRSGLSDMGPVCFQAMAG